VRALETGAAPCNTGPEAQPAAEHSAGQVTCPPVSAACGRQPWRRPANAEGPPTQKARQRRRPGISRIPGLLNLTSVGGSGNLISPVIIGQFLCLRSLVPALASNLSRLLVGSDLESPVSSPDRPLIVAPVRVCRPDYSGCASDRGGGAGGRGPFAGGINDCLDVVGVRMNSFTVVFRIRAANCYRCSGRRRKPSRATSGMRFHFRAAMRCWPDRSRRGVHSG
jgi:hypothetical protein